MDEHHKEVARDIAFFIEADVTLLLPLATILETGNHIAKVKPVSRRRILAQNFVAVLQNEPPWAITPIFDTPELEEYLKDFPEHVMSDIGVGDLIIYKEYEQRYRATPSMEIRIWTYDNDFKMLGCRCHP